MVYLSPFLPSIT